VVLHMPIGYTAAFAQRLAEECAIDVVEASEGLTLRPGLAVIARAGQHLLVDAAQGELLLRLSYEPSAGPHRPSVDVLFESASSLGAEVLAVVLTGMGDDGTEGARALRAAGATILTESESSCVVYGMPRSVKESGLSSADAPIQQMNELILKHL
jgi:two-component system, chemotaxis family, protein-glutamate methylesterase/glutaminase